MGWECRDLLQRGGAGLLACCQEDVKVLCTWDGDVEVLYSWVQWDSPAAMRMQGSFRSSVSGAPTWDSGFTEGCSMNICRTERRTELQQYNSPRYIDRNRISFVDIVHIHICCEISLMYTMDLTHNSFFINQILSGFTVFRSFIYKNVWNKDLACEETFKGFVYNNIYLLFRVVFTLTSVQQSQGGQDQEWCFLPRELVHDAPKRRPN